MLPDGARCLCCRYALAGVLVDRCPECGQAFDRVDPSTVFVPGIARGWKRHAVRPPGFVLNGSALVACVTLIWAFSPPADSYFLATLFGGGWFFLCAVFWVIRAIIAGGVARATRGYSTHIRPRWKKWLLLPVMITLTTILLQLEVPRYVRFAFARPTLEQAAKAALHGPVNPTGPVRVAAPLLAVRGPHAENGVVLFYVPGPGFLNTVTLVYVPENETAAAVPGHLMRVRHFTGRWYVGWEDF